MRRYRLSIHAAIYATLSLCLIYILHLLPVNQLFIDPFSEAIKHHDVMDIAISKFRNHDDPRLFDPNIIIVNSGITDREKLATAIRLIDYGGAKTIGFDLFLDTLYQKKSDTSLQLAMQHASDKLVLGYTLKEKSDKISEEVNLSSLPFFSNGLKEAYVNLGTNDGFSVRAYKPFIENSSNEHELISFSTQLASNFDSTVLQNLHKRHHESEWINFKRVQPGNSSMKFPINSKKVVHYIQMEIDKLIADSSAYNTGFFKNKIVLIGFCGEHENSLSMNDRYFTPLNEQYTGRSLPDMFGVLIHANIISMLLNKEFITEIPESIIFIIAFLISFLNFFSFKKIVHTFRFMQHPFVRIFQIFEFMFVFSVAIILLAFWNLKLGFFFIATTIVLSFELYLIYEKKLDEYFDSLIFKEK